MSSQGKLGYILLNSEGNKTLKLKIYCIRHPEDCGFVIDPEGTEVSLVDEINVDQLHKLATIEGTEKEKVGKFDVKLKIIQDDDGTFKVKYEDKDMIV